MSNPSKKVASYLLSINAVQLNVNNPFTWASGLRSPIYCDNRKLLSFVEVRNEIKTIMAEKSGQFGQAEMVAGVATAGIPLGMLLADSLQLPFIYVRSKAKGHGLKSKIEGHFEKGKKILVIEDLISTGGSSIEAVESLREEGLEVLGVMSVFSYELDLSEKNFEDASCQYYSLSGFSDLIQVAADEKKISEEDLIALEEWRKNPLDWSNKKN
ncbi:MAG: orotate phosphoribosyltransferase [Saprospirales bacterium]|nr:MAG: orotate phosphoribosyltransferase [Saprospirales bacterium]